MHKKDAWHHTVNVLWASHEVLGWVLTTLGPMTAKSWIQPVPGSHLGPGAMQVDHTVLGAVQVCGAGDWAADAALAGLLAGQLLDGRPLQALRHRPHGAGLWQQPQIHRAV